MVVVDKAWLVMTILLIFGAIISFIIGYTVFKAGDNYEMGYNIMAKFFGLVIIGFGVFLGYEAGRCIKSLRGQD